MGTAGELRDRGRKRGSCKERGDSWGTGKVEMRKERRMENTDGASISERPKHKASLSLEGFRSRLKEDLQLRVLGS